MLIKDLDFIQFFQFYGVISSKSKLFKLWTIVLTLLGFCASWLTWKDAITRYPSKSLFGMVRRSLITVAEIVRISTMISTMIDAKNIGKIFEEFRGFDDELEKFNKFEMKSSIRFVKLAGKTLIFLAISSSVLYVSAAFDDEVLFQRAVLVLFICSFIQVKGLSFVYLGDMLNFRLGKLWVISKSDQSLEILKLHTKLFLLSKRINRSYGFMLTLIFTHCCYANTSHIYNIFLYAYLFNAIRLARKFNLHLRNILKTKI